MIGSQLSSRSIERPRAGASAGRGDSRNSLAMPSFLLLIFFSCSVSLVSPNAVFLSAGAPFLSAASGRWISSNAWAVR